MEEKTAIDKSEIIRPDTADTQSVLGQNADRYFKQGIHFIEYIGLAIIAIATVFAGYDAVMEMIHNREVHLGDLLLLFLYLEVLAMVAIYIDSGKLPVRLPMYIAIVALARYLILEMKDLSEWQMIAVAATITLITISTLILRYGHIKFPYPENRRKTKPSAYKSTND
ncbi:phosphate-starvation-inducible protein PsiE [Thiomicrorhabdus sediminis]|uniref:Protein PsiE n=1 Tax=Thiomicrorhabdus sediminis TaxID=2580412 RepID=A0A4P9K3B4_9GAMM|nr:phosphate-starvation-inducible PsiE family protein [Thiomicrorhabdus sediminis]QCU89374.1 phosphate-starvation-inducible E [Thiomicrorhabdus sediminis]